MIEIINTIKEYKDYTNNEHDLLPNTVYFIIEDRSCHFITKNIDGELKKYDMCEFNKNAEIVYDWIVDCFNEQTERTMNFKNPYEKMHMEKGFRYCYNTFIYCNGVELTDEQYLKCGAIKPSTFKSLKNNYSDNTDK